MKRLLVLMLAILGLASNGLAQNGLNLFVGQAIRLEMRQVWTGSIDFKNSFDRLEGSATSSTGRAGLFPFFVADGSGKERLIFDIAYVSNRVDTHEYCYLPYGAAPLSAGVYVGDRYFSTNGLKGIVNDGFCRMVIGSVTQSKDWPPSQLLAAGVAVHVQARDTWAGTVTRFNETGDWAGDVTTKLGSGKIAAYIDETGSFTFRVNYLVGGVSQLQLCRLELTGAQLTRGMYLGKRYFFSGDFKASDKLNPDGDCSVTIGVSDSSRVGVLVWPPGKLLSAGLPVKLELREVWTGTLSAQNDQNDWRGTASAPNGTRGYLFTYDNKVSFDFVVTSTSDAGAQFEMCHLETSATQVSPGVYVGQRRVSANQDPYRADGECRVTIGTPPSNEIEAGMANAGRVVPVETLLNTGVLVGIDARQSWFGMLSGRDAQGAWLSDTTSTEGGATLREYINSRGGLEFVVSYTAGGIFQAEYCVLEPGDTQLSPGVYAGKRYFYANPDKTPALDGVCRVSIHLPPSGTGQVASLLAAGLLLRIEARTNWTGSLTGQNADGDWVSRPRNADGALGYLFAFPLEGGGFEFEVRYVVGTSVLTEYCKLEAAAAPISPGVYLGKRLFNASANGKPEPDGECRVTVGLAASK